MTRPAPDADSLRYARWWEPVLAGPAHRLLERIDVLPATLLDVGTGTGLVALAAAERWPQARVIGLDASAGMLSVARSRSDAGDAGEERFSWLIADATSMPLADASVDAATSSFALQLVADRVAVLREIRRVLRPGGVLVLVTWLADDLELAADEAFTEALAELGLDDVEMPDFRPPRITDYRSPEEAKDELMAAGFEQVEVDTDGLCHAWTREAFLDFKLDYDERELVISLEPETRSRLRTLARARFTELPESAFVVQGSLVSARGRR